MPDVSCDILIVGGSLGGVAAALRAGEMGKQVCLVEASGWLGGQISSQGVCAPDENAQIETIGATGAYRRFRNQARQFYRDNYGLSAAGQAERPLNIGGCWVNDGFAVQPLVAHKLFYDSLISLGTVEIHLNTSITSGEVENDTVVSVSGVGPDELPMRFTAPFVLDATDLGDLLPLLSVEYRLGADSKEDTDEPNALETADSRMLQPLTYPFAIELRPFGENHRISRPEGYDAIRAAQNFGEQFGNCEKGITTFRRFWTYRRFIDSSLFSKPGPLQYDLSMINMDCNDFLGGSVPSGNRERDDHILKQARQTSLAYLYWLQTDCRRGDKPGTSGYPELRPAVEVFNTSDAIAPLPYIRESRRIQALITIKEQDISVNSGPGPRASLFGDSCGIGQYAMDIHGEQGGSNTYPFQIPLGALIPMRVTNLIAACKNIGTTHLTNGAYRVHPIEWGIGESAGALAAFCLTQGITPHRVHADKSVGGALHQFQKTLLDRTVPLYWWLDVLQDNQNFTAIHMMGVLGIMEGYAKMQFRPDLELTTEQRDAITITVQQQYSIALNWPPTVFPRGDAATWILQQLGIS